MSLVEQFVRTAKAHERKLAVIDRATGQRVTYRDTLLRSLILSHAFRRYEPGMIGVMIPTSGGAIYSVIAALMSGRTPVMINYSTGAAQNCEMAQRRLAFRTIITSRALLEKIKCPAVDGHGLHRGPRRRASRRSPSSAASSAPRCRRIASSATCTRAGRTTTRSSCSPAAASASRRPCR